MHFAYHICTCTILCFIHNATHNAHLIYIHTLIQWIHTYVHTSVTDVLKPNLCMYVCMCIDNGWIESDSVNHGFIKVRLSVLLKQTSYSTYLVSFILLCIYILLMYSYYFTVKVSITNEQISNRSADDNNSTSVALITVFTIFAVVIMIIISIVAVLIRKQRIKKSFEV